MKIKKLTILLLALVVVLGIVFAGLCGLVNTLPGFHPVHLFSKEVYYLLPSGKKAKGFQTIDQHTYYFDQDGTMLKGVVKTEKGTFYFNQQGQQETGLHQGYYFDEQSGQPILSSFKRIKGKDVYFGPDGKTVKGSVNINGQTLTFNQKGELQMDLSFLDQLIQEHQATWGGKVSFYIKELESGQTHSLQEETYYPCSIIKLFMLAVIYDQIDQQKLSLDQDKIHLLEEMIIRSSNDAYNTLVTWVGHDDPVKGLAIANAFLEKIGIKHTKMHHALEPSILHFRDKSGKKNTTTAKDIATVLEWIHHHPRYQKDMVDLLNRCGDIFGLKSGTPYDLVFAHKTGEAVGYYHDGGIVYLNNRPYIVVMCSYQLTYVKQLYGQVAEELVQYEKQLNDLTGS